MSQGESQCLLEVKIISRIMGYDCTWNVPIKELHAAYLRLGYWYTINPVCTALEKTIQHLVLVGLLCSRISEIFTR